MPGLSRMPVPQHIVDQAQAYATGDATPVEPRNAATVVLMRDGASGPEVYLLRRHLSMAFAADMCVFPGGGVDPRDFAEDLAWTGPSVESWATTLDCDPALARALVCAAVRETFEESGVLLAGSSADSVVDHTTGDDWEADRAALESNELSMHDFLGRRGLVLRTDLLGAWSGWLTPIFEPKRYRTWFFVASLPHGQATRDVSSESSEVTWLPAMSAVSSVEQSEMLMLPPTYLTCLEIGQRPTVAEVMVDATSRTVEMFTPEVTAAGDEFVLSTPAAYEALLDSR